MISKAILIFALLRVWTCAELACHREIPSRGEVKVAATGVPRCETKFFSTL
jgi:hypothetical protein